MTAPETLPAWRMGYVNDDGAFQRGGWNRRFDRPSLMWFLQGRTMPPALDTDEYREARKWVTSKASYEPLSDSEDGWTIRAEIYNDWYSWVEDFVATHPVHGTITRKGDDVTAPSKEVWDAFVKAHPLLPFDYADI